MSEEILHINPYEVRFLIHRDRDEENFKLMKDSIRKEGLIQPLHVRSITDVVPDSRRRKDGGLYKWEAAFGEGRTRAFIELHKSTKDDRWLKLPAKEKAFEDAQMVGAFLSENILRRDYSWLEQAKLIRDDLKAGDKIEDVAKRFYITTHHAARLVRLIKSMSPKAEKELKSISIADAEKLTTLPESGQEIVIETLKEQGLDPAQLSAVVRKASDLKEKLSKTALKASLKRLDEDLDRQRKKLKLARLHWSLGVSNLKVLLSQAPFRKAAERAGINISKFEQEAV